MYTMVQVAIQYRVHGTVDMQQNTIVTAPVVTGVIAHESFGHALETVSRRPGFLHIHGGGYVMGTPEMSDARNRLLAADIGCVIVSVDYRQSPETPHPGPVEDCYAALKWMHANAASLDVDPARIAIGGESAGGGLAAALALLARDAKQQWQNQSYVTGELAYHGGANQPKISGVASADINAPF